MVKIGDTAPAFDLPGSDGARYTLASLRGKQVVLYFYPKDDTPGCTVEAKDFSAALAQFEALGAVVLGVSRDTTKRHQGFCQKHTLTVTLLSDEDADVHRAWGAWGQKTLYGRTSEGCIRSTFVIDGDGVVRAAWSPVRVPGHVEAVLATLRGAAPSPATAKKTARKP